MSEETAREEGEMTMPKHIEHWLCLTCKKAYMDEAGAVECERLHALGYRQPCKYCEGTGQRHSRNVHTDEITHADCEWCYGVGIDPATRPDPCACCGGEGKTRREDPCGHCGGNGLEPLKGVH